MPQEAKTQEEELGAGTKMYVQHKLHIQYKGQYRLSKSATNITNNMSRLHDHHRRNSRY
jgi:hypothetical protein